MNDKVGERVDTLERQLAALNERVNAGFRSAAEGVEARMGRVEEFQGAAYKRFDELTERFDGANNEQHKRRDALERKLHDRIDKQNDKFTAHFRWLIGIALVCITATLAAIGVIFQALSLIIDK